MGFLKGDLLFDRTRARVRRKPSSRRSGINPGENLDNGREELAFLAPVKSGLFINDDDLTSQATCHRLPRKGSFLSAFNDQEVRR